LVALNLDFETGAAGDIIENTGPAKTRRKQEQREEARQQKLAQAMARLGVRQVPAHYNACLPLAQLEIEGPVSREEERSAGQLANNIRALGTVLHPPVVEENYDRYRVLAGRRRVLAARLAGLEQLECRVYPGLTPEQRRALSLSENFARNPNRRLELEGVYRLVRDNMAVTEKELCAIFGLSPGTARRYLKIALLPGMLAEETVAGNIPLGLAGQICRLSGEQQAELAGQVEAGQAISEEQVHQLRYARASRNLKQLEAGFTEVTELADRLLNEGEAAQGEIEGAPLTRWGCI
jgi:ParB family chromosome partitioning protein